VPAWLGFLAFCICFSSNLAGLGLLAYPCLGVSPGVLSRGRPCTLPHVTYLSQGLASSLPVSFVFMPHWEGCVHLWAYVGITNFTRLCTPEEGSDLPVSHTVLSPTSSAALDMGSTSYIFQS
jgi:hypothetical protein